MTTSDNSFAEIEALRNDYKSLTEKIKSQEIINETLIKKVQSNVLDNISRWYRNRMAIVPIVAILALVFSNLGFDRRYILLVILCGAAQFILDRICFHMLGMNDLMEQDMATASKRILSHRKARKISEAVMIIPFAAMLIWTLYIAGGEVWNPGSYIFTLIVLALVFGRAIRIAKYNKKELDEFVRSRGLKNL